MSPFREHYDSFDPETLVLLEVAFTETWTELKRNGESLDQESLRKAIADCLISLVQHGETDPKKLKASALAAFIR